MIACIYNRPDYTGRLNRTENIEAIRSGDDFVSIVKG